jgi:hypothetical protein
MKLPVETLIIFILTVASVYFWTAFKDLGEYGSKNLDLRFLDFFLLLAHAYLLILKPLRSNGLSNLFYKKPKSSKVMNIIYKSLHVFYADLESSPPVVIYKLSSRSQNQRRVCYLKLCHDGRYIITHNRIFHAESS